MMDVKSAVEAILFAAGDSVPIARLSLVIGTDESEIERAVDELAAEYVAQRLEQNRTQIDADLSHGSRQKHSAVEGFLLALLLYVLEDTGIHEFSNGRNDEYLCRLIFLQILYDPLERVVYAQRIGFKYASYDVKDTLIGVVIRQDGKALSEDLCHVKRVDYD